jgi:hypothetical protein
MRAVIHLMLLFCLALQMPSLEWRCTRSMGGFSAQGREFCRQACQQDRLALASRGAHAADLRQEATCGNFALSPVLEALVLQATPNDSSSSQACLAVPSPSLTLQDAPFPMAALPQAAGLPARPGLRLPYAQAPPA